MASHSASKESSLFLWFIVPIAALLTLLFVSVNHNTVPPKEVLDGTRMRNEVPAPAATMMTTLDTTAVADTTQVDPANVPVDPTNAAH